MTAAQQIPLGTPIPPTTHAVSVSIPTMKDVIGYEEKKAATMAKLDSGYPRFVIHRYLRQIEAHWQRLFAKPDSSIWLVSSETMASELRAYLKDVPSKLVRHRGVCGLLLKANDATNKQAKSFLQHVGGFLSSRQAEAYLAAEGILPENSEEHRATDNPTKALQDFLAPILEVPSSDVLLANTGMNAFYATFKAVNKIQAAKGRRSWIKLGWLYTDSMHILDKLSADSANNIEILDVFDTSTLETVLAERGSEFAGILTEAPTNPLIQTPDLEQIHRLAKKYEIYFIVDPTVNSPANVSVSKFCDIVTTSLTKYVASDGDVIMGAVAVCEGCSARADVQEAVAAQLEPTWPADIARLAAQLENFQANLELINQNTADVIDYLEKHPKVRHVYWALDGHSKENYLRIARSESAIGGLISFEIKGSMPHFFDTIELPKGPSFGMKNSLLCPFIYLAHYDLINCPAGQQKLKTAGINTELIRFAVGTEPIQTIIQELESALERA